MEFDALNIISVIFSIASFIWSIFSEQYRIIAVLIGFVLIIIILVSEQNKRVNSLLNEHKRLEEKLKIHEQLINIKADIQELQKKVFKK